MTEQKKKKNTGIQVTSEDLADNRSQERWTRCYIQGNVLEEEGLENEIKLWVLVEALSSACFVLGA